MYYSIEIIIGLPGMSNHFNPAYYFFQTSSGPKQKHARGVIALSSMLSKMLRHRVIIDAYQDSLFLLTPPQYHIIRC